MNLKKNIKTYLRKKLIGNDSPSAQFEDMDNDFYQHYYLCNDYTMTGIEVLYSLFNSVKYIINNSIEGDFVECGVWKGGSAMLMASTLKLSNKLKTFLYLYDTFEGMTDPTEKDIDLHDQKASDMLSKSSKEQDTSIWCYSSLEDVKKNLGIINYPSVKYIKGPVEETIPDIIPEKISLLRLDTDFHSSTYHNLKYLFPKLVKGGILILDDYGHWKSARDATDQYFRETNVKPLLIIINYSARLMIKC